MTNLLYWLVYHVDLGPFGQRAMRMAVQSWLRRDARANEPNPLRVALNGINPARMQKLGN